jgi:hypothetical protein
VIEVPPTPDATYKILYLASAKMNERDSKRALKDFFLIKEELLSKRGAQDTEKQKMLRHTLHKILDTMVYLLHSLVISVL